MSLIKLGIVCKSALFLGNCKKLQTLYLCIKLKNKSIFRIFPQFRRLQQFKRIFARYFFFVQAKTSHKHSLHSLKIEHQLLLKSSSNINKSGEYYKYAEFGEYTEYVPSSKIIKEIKTLFKERLSSSAGTKITKITCRRRKNCRCQKPVRTKNV